MKSAKLGGLKEKRHAAFELASLAATGEDTKFRIVAEDGLVFHKSFKTSKSKSCIYLYVGVEKPNLIVIGVKYCLA